MRRVARRVVAFTHDASDTGWRHPFWQLPQTCRWSNLVCNGQVS